MFQLRTYFIIVLSCKEGVWASWQGILDGLEKVLEEGVGDRRNYEGSPGKGGGRRGKDGSL